MLILRVAAVLTVLAGALSGMLVFVLRTAFSLKSRKLFIPVFLIFEAVLLFGVFERRAPLFGKVLWRKPANPPAVALTFDDGPNEPYSSRVLDILRRYGVKATFFLLGENAARYPETVRRMVSEGHELGNHTWNHEVLPLKSPGYIRNQIRWTAAVIHAFTGIRPRLFRAPHGWRNPFVNPVARREGCTPVAWTLGVWDTDRPGAEAIVRRTLKGLRNGCILLVHDGRGVEVHPDSSQLVEALPIIIEAGRRKGLRFLTLSEMMREG
jgi:peptidoglycan-N-acetylglucosamine deacetylase